MNCDVDKAVDVLRKGGLILYPTDTIWGIGCDATNSEAVERIYTLKNRRDKKTMLVLVDTETMLQQYVREVPEIAWQLLEVSEKPLTIIYPGAKNIAANLMAEDGSIGIRISKDDLCLELINKFKKPVVSTSANISDDVSPRTFHDISEKIKMGVDYIVSWRQNDTKPGRASSIIKLETNGTFSILRN
ncbi:MAG: threonylcarbamoyl-AMP synthase [Bacteroidales bacterium]|nr:threonylcarbamoyl-AMP synthase [Bacteroidales bacterium]